MKLDPIDAENQRDDGEGIWVNRLHLYDTLDRKISKHRFSKHSTKIDYKLFLKHKA